MANRSGWVELRCSFCKKSEVRKLIAGPSVFICDECVDVCQDIIANDNRLQATDEVEPPLQRTEGAPNGPSVRCTLCGTVAPYKDVIPIQRRGVMCLGCAGEVEAAVAKRRQSGYPNT
jgi:hypothetical protein